MSKPITIAAMWATFSKAIFGDEKPSSVQYNETRRAFYAGYHAALMDCKLKVTALSERDGCKALADLELEALEFALEVSRGLA